MTEPDAIVGRKPDYISKSGSSYYFCDQGVYRRANHWGRAANCRWRLEGEAKVKPGMHVGYANWTDFYPNIATENLYWIHVDWKSLKVTYQHKAFAKTDKEIFRTAANTSKRIQQLRKILENTFWARHIKYGDYDKLQTFVVDKLLCTNLSLREIKAIWEAEIRV